MKIRLLGLAFAAFGFYFASCNNGAYDAQPAVDGSSIQNPINPTLTAAKGTMKARIDGQFYTFDTARFSLQDSVLLVGGVYAVPGETTRFIQFAVRPYKGVRTYTLLDTGGTAYYAGAAYATIYGTDTAGYNLYNTAWAAKRGEGEVKVELSNAGEIKGTFKFTAFRERPASADAKVVISDGSFWVTPE